MLADINKTDAQIAHHLQISLRTLQRYKRNDSAPRAILMALFFETQWGKSAVDADSANTAQVWRQYAQALERQIVAMRAQIDELEKLRSDGAANEPFFKRA